MRISTVCLLAALVFYQVESYKILVYSNLFGHSHVKFMGTIADTLTDAGHDVTVLMPLMDMNERNRTGFKRTKKAIFVDTDPRLALQMEENRKKFQELWTLNNANPFAMVHMIRDMANMFTYQCEAVISDMVLLETLKNEKFDLGIAEPFDQCPYAVFDAIGIRAHVAAISCVALDHVSTAIGQPVAPSYVPGTQSVLSEKMTFKERIQNWLMTKVGEYIFSYVGDTESAAVQKIIPSIRHWTEVLPEASFLLANSVPLLDFPAPTISKIISIGGVTVNTLKKDVTLPEKWDKVLSERKRTVLVSFGSNAKSVHMPDEYKQSLLKVFEMMPDTTFIWKYEEPDSKLADHLPNVHLGTWLPQNELLADPRLTAFLTHGGLASTMELAMLGKPAIMVPLFADQGRNAQMLSRHGGAATLQKTDLAKPDVIKATIEKVINDPGYAKAAERVSAILQNQPTNPRETLVKYVEFAARFGKMPTMDPYGRHLNFIQYYLLDVYAAFVSVAIIAIVALFFVVKFVFSLCFKSKVKKD